MKHTEQGKKTEQKMRISFDLDEVLFVSPLTHKTEPELHFPFNKIYRERLRLGAPELIHDLQSQGIEVWVYTSSFRTEKYIRRLFRHYGVHFDSIVNGFRHEEEVQAGKSARMPNKVPSYYRISLHIDDEDIVKSSSRAYGYNAYQLEAQDDEWADKLKKRVMEIKDREERERKNRI